MTHRLRHAFRAGPREQSVCTVATSLYNSLRVSVCGVLKASRLTYKQGIELAFELPERIYFLVPRAACEILSLVVFVAKCVEGRPAGSAISSERRSEYVHGTLNDICNLRLSDGDEALDCLRRENASAVPEKLGKATIANL